jgi:hypothetical protein
MISNRAPTAQYDMTDEQIQAYQEAWAIAQAAAQDAWDAIQAYVRDFIRQLDSWYRSIPACVRRAILGRSERPMRKKIRRYLFYCQSP